MPAPGGDGNEACSFNLQPDYDDYVGKIVIGRIEGGTVKRTKMVVCRKDGTSEPIKIAESIYSTD